MTFTGHMQNGVVVFDSPVPIPEGMAVTVAQQVTSDPPPPVETLPEMTFAERYKDLIGSVDLPEDAALNHDHYLYGLPKVTDRVTPS